MLCRALLALASIRHEWKAPGATRACALRSLPALTTKWKAPMIYHGPALLPTSTARWHFSGVEPRADARTFDFVLTLRA